MKCAFAHLAVFLLTSITAHAASAPKPNILYILCDDLGYAERGKIKTPCLDKLAEQGMRFTDAHSGSSVCTPTRNGVLTGRYAWHTRLQVVPWRSKRTDALTHHVENVALMDDAQDRFAGAEVLHAYTRKDALNDGVQIDVSETARAPKPSLLPCSRPRCRTQAVFVEPS